MTDILSMLSTVFGAFAGTHDLFSGGWGWLQLIVDAISSISESISALAGA